MIDLLNIESGPLLYSYNWSFTAVTPLTWVMTLLTIGRVGGLVCSALFWLRFSNDPCQWTGTRSGSMVVWFNKDQENHCWEIVFVRSWREHQTPMFNANNHHHDHPERCRNIHTHKIVCYTIFGCCICSSFPNLLQKSTFVNFWLNVDQLIEITYFEKKSHSPFSRGEHYCSVTLGSRFPRFRRLKKMFFRNGK